MNNDFDVIIVGAGPAGLQCALELKNTKFSVLVIEKNEIIGPKICAGGITNLGAKFDFPQDKVKNFKNNAYYLNGKKYKGYFFEGPIRIIDRKEMGKHQLSKLEDAKNISILRGVKVEKICKEKILTSRGDFKFKYLVGADGSNSIVRRYLGLESKFFVAVRYIIKTKLEVELSNFYIPKELECGYIWIFPHLENTNVGVYFNPQKVHFNRAKSNLDEFLKKHNLDRFEREEGSAPLNYLYKGCVFKNIFLIGDAAGLVFKSTGEGISQGMISGSEVAKKIKNPNYKMEGMKKVLRFKKRQEMLYNFCSEIPFLHNFLAISIFYSMRNKKIQKYLGL